MTRTPFSIRLGHILERTARRDIPDTLNLWPAIARRLEQPRHDMHSTHSAQTTDDHTWTTPALDRRRATNTTEEQQIMSDLSHPHPIPIAQRGWVREALKFVAAAIVFIGIGILLTLILHDSDNDQQPGIIVPLPTSSPSAVTTPSLAVTPAPTNPAVIPTTTANPTELPASNPTPTVPHGTTTTTIAVGAGPFGITTGAGAIWVPNIGDGTLSRIDSTTNQVVATIDIGATPSDPFNVPSMPMSVAASDTAVWVTRYDSSDSSNVIRDLLRIDPATDTIVATIPLTVTPHFIALGEGALWVLSSNDNAVLRVDTDTNQVVAAIELSHPLFIAIGEGSVWVSNGPSTSTSGPVTRTVAEIDPATNTIVGTFGIDQNTIYIAAGAGAVWVDNGINNEVLRVDPETYEITARIYVTLGAVPTVSDGMLWGHTGSLRSISQIDPATNTVVATYPSGGLGGPIAVADGVIWIADTSVNRVIRVDPSN